MCFDIFGIAKKKRVESSHKKHDLIFKMQQCMFVYEVHGQNKFSLDFGFLCESLKFVFNVMCRARRSKAGRKC
jgi:hypothetical protein